MDYCEFDGVSLQYDEKGPQINVTMEGCKGTLREEGLGLKRKVLRP